MVKIQKYKYTKNKKKIFSKKIKQNTRDYSSKQGKNNIQFKNITNYSKYELDKYVPIITRNTKNVYMPILGFFSINIIMKLKKFDRCFFVFQNNIIIGCIFFHNLTYNFKYNMLGNYINNDDFKSKSDINTYMMNWLFWSDSITPTIFNRSISLLKNINKLDNKNIIITTFTFIHFKEYNILTELFQVSQLSLQEQLLNIAIGKYKPIIEYTNSDEYKLLIKLGFTHCGYHSNINDELLNIFTIRYINKCTSKDFQPVYIITRQIDSNPDFFVKIDNFQNFLEQSKLFKIENVNRYALDNLFTFYIPTSTENDLCTKSKTVPYEYNFITNYINNTLGNSHIINNYVFLYFAVREYLGTHSNILKKQFAEVITSYDRLVEAFKEKSFIRLIPFTINYNYCGVSGGFNNLDKFNEFINKYHSHNVNGMYITNYGFVKNLYPVKSKTNYHIKTQLIFVLNKNKLNVYVYHMCELVIFKETDEELNSNKETRLKDWLYPPMNFNYIANEYFNDSIDVNNIMFKIRQLCTIIGKVYKKHATLNINQMNGFLIIEPYIKLIKDPQTKEIYPMLYYITSDFELSLKDEDIKKQSQWIYELAISPILDENQRVMFDHSIMTESEKLSYQPLEI